MINLKEGMDCFGSVMSFEAISLYANSNHNLMIAYSEGSP